jgi:hypothetical protein
VAQVSVITAGNRDILLFYVRRKECFQNFEWELNAFSRVSADTKSWRSSSWSLFDREQRFDWRGRKVAQLGIDLIRKYQASLLCSKTLGDQMAYSTYLLYSHYVIWWQDDQIILKRMNPSCWSRGTIYPQKLALTSPTSGGRSVGIFRSRTEATELRF